MRFKSSVKKVAITLSERFVSEKYPIIFAPSLRDRVKLIYCTTIKYLS